MDSMHVVANGLSCRPGGGLSYFLGVVPELAKQLVGAERLTVLASPLNAGQMLEAFEPDVVRVVPVRGAGMRLAYEQLLMPMLNRNAVLYCPGNFSPVLYGSKRSVLVLQNSIYFGSASLSRRGRIERRLCHRSFSSAGAVVVISNSLQRRIDGDPSVSERENVKVIPSGFTANPPAAVEPANSPGAKPFFLVLGHDYPHKRLGDIVQAWAASRRAESHELVVAGHVSDERKSALTSDLPPEVRSTIRFLNVVVDQAEVSWLFQNAVCLVSASEAEAHPLTLAEAGAVGCPLILSSIDPHHEVATTNADFFPVGDSGLLTGLINDAGDTKKFWEWPVSWEDHALKLVSFLHQRADFHSS